MASSRSTGIASSRRASTTCSISNLPEVGSSNTGANGGYVREKSAGAYLEASGDLMVNDHRLRYTAGACVGAHGADDRWAHQHHRSAQPVPGSNPQVQIPDGARYPTLVNFATTEHTVLEHARLRSRWRSTSRSRRS